MTGECEKSSIVATRIVFDGLEYEHMFHSERTRLPELACGEILARVSQSTFTCDIEIDIDSSMLLLS
jgi:hypothetical protein